MPSFYLNTYAPLAASKAGREASERYGIPPLVDGSIRREPDLEHEFPSISCLCRGGNFAPRLQRGDVVGYLTKKSRWGGSESLYRLAAVLRVLESLPSHEAGAVWYRNRGLRLPSNCHVRGNEAKPFEHSHRIFRKASGCTSGASIRREWDSVYEYRAHEFPAFVVCEPLFRELTWKAPIVRTEDLIAAFGKAPGTHNPGALAMAEGQRLLRRMQIRVPKLS